MPLIILFLYLLSTLAAAQEASGLVVDASDNSPLPFAHALHTTRSIGNVTDNQGRHTVLTGYENSLPELVPLQLHSRIPKQFFEIDHPVVHHLYPFDSQQFLHRKRRFKVHLSGE